MALHVDYVGILPSAETIQKQVNSRYDKLMFVDEWGTRIPYVCVVCDRYLVSRDDNERIQAKSLCAMKPLLSWERHPDARRKEPIENYYRFRNENMKVEDALEFTNGMALSPRALYYKPKGSGRKAGFSCCPRCKTNVLAKKLPRHAIVNRNYVGVAPQCLEALSAVELAFITPVLSYGYCFHWTGGTRLKGTLTFMKIAPNSISNAVMTLDSFGLNDHVLVLFTGTMRTSQKRRAKELSTIRTQEVIQAVRWLCENNHQWQGVNADDILNDLESKKPRVYDNSANAINDSNVETEETFTVYYPDGATNPNAGGMEDSAAFKKYVEEMAQKGFDVQFQANLQKEYVKESDSYVLVNSGLLQFPYGIGGMNERRELHDGQYTDASDIQEHLVQLSLRAQPQFQASLFTLIMYSLLSRYRMLKGSRLQLKGMTDATNLATGLTSGDVRSSINARRRRNYFAGTGASRKFLDAVDATCKSLPHTNDATKYSRGISESMQHHFGMCSVFLTVTFDDENSVLMQAFHKAEDDETCLDQLTAEELIDRYDARKKIRIQYPGIAALNFQMLLEILIEEVVGWNLKKNCSTGKPGFFGVCEALSAAMEEQGRESLHTHMTIWIKNFRRMQDDFFFGETQQQKQRAILQLQNYTEHIGSTALFPEALDQIAKSFDHECSERVMRRRMPLKVVDAQSLRNLRNIHGYKESNGVFASCPTCGKTWTYEQMLIDHLRNSKGIAMEMNEARIIPRARMLSEIVRYQKHGGDPPCTIINAACQHHKSCHVSGCFKCKKLKRKTHQCGPACECRYRLPDLPRKRAKVLVDEKCMKWYSWNGSVYMHPLAHVLPKRRKYDLFQNTACQAVSHSKFGCNSNVSAVLDGPVGQYQHKYQVKDTQADDRKGYEEVEEAVKRFEGSRKHEEDRPEALRRICAAAFAHNKKNIIGSSMASYLLRHDSRFIFSHEFKYCALKDVVRLHNKQDVCGILKYTVRGDCFFENTALDYLCRGVQLEELSLCEFTERYFTKEVSNNNEDEIIPFEPTTKSYQHPSLLKQGKNKGKCAKGSISREEISRIRVSQWMFPDTATFEGNCLSCATIEFVPPMEQYAQLVLSLFMAHRDATDLKADCHKYPYLQKMREVYNQDQRRKEQSRKPIVFTERNIDFLQNVQNCRSNTIRYKFDADELSRQTEPFQSSQCEQAFDDIAEDEEDIDITAYELFKEQIEKEMDSDRTELRDRNPEFLPADLKGFSLDKARNKGRDRCGYQQAFPSIILPETERERQIVSQEDVSDAATEVEINPVFLTERPIYTARDIVKVHLTRRAPTVNRSIFKDAELQLTTATGAVKSVLEWSEDVFAQDAIQKRAFEVLCAAFLLTFYDDVPDDDNSDRGDISKYRKEKGKLVRLRGTDKNLICLLHGPGGSGKSTVINVVMLYAKEYCENLGHPFTIRTIVVTAMSGVAATLLKGETTHSVLGLCRSNVTSEEIDEWVDTRMVIVDEVSFASGEDFAKMHEHMKQFMNDHYSVYGGMNMIFAGDFSQLEPVSRDPIYKDGESCPEFQDLLNCYIELDGRWRFKNDTVWGDIMSRFRSGDVKDADVEKINDECLHKTPPAGIQVATSRNCDRDAVNADIFYRFTRDNRPADGNIFHGACMIFMDDLHMTNVASAPVAVTSNMVKRHFYENASEDDCSKKRLHNRYRVDPALKIYYDVPLMYSRNSDVAAGEANGSRVRGKIVKLKVGEHSFPLVLENETTIHGVMASQVDFVLVEHENEDMRPRQFKVSSKQFTFNCLMRIGRDESITSMTGKQFPIISNSCTTGHKLQGCTVENILVNDWQYAANWAYVVLSRVKTMAGLFLRQPLTSDLTKYEKPKAMKKMLQDFKQRILVRMLEEDEYNKLKQSY